MPVEYLKDAIMPAVESSMLYGCLTMTQDMGKGLLVVPSNLAADGAKVRGNLSPSAQVGAVWK